VSHYVVLVNMVFIRLAILSLYQRLFGMYRITLRLVYAGYVTIALVALPEFGVAVGRTALCNTSTAPRDATFCSVRNINIALISATTSWMLVDVYIYSISLSRLRILHIQSCRRIQLMMLFGFGLG
jgi:hypothetical protein